MVWIVDSTQLAPLVGPCFESWWSDWCIAQPGTLTLRWLVREFNSKSLGQAGIDEDILSGKLFGQSAKLWSPPSGFRPVVPAHGQVNWLGFRGDDFIAVGFANYGEAGSLSCVLDSRDIAGGAISPRSLHRFSDGTSRVEAWKNVSPIQIGAGETVFLVWDLKK